MTVAGLDGCRGGWVCAIIDPENKYRIGIYPTFQAFWDANPDLNLVLIDIPIGLKDSGIEPRVCDAEARRILGRPRSSSIFPVPCRAAVYASSFLEACEINVQNCGKRVSKQAWNIVPKIRELDILLRSDPKARGIIHESHPELCLWALAGGHAMQFYKKKPAGKVERRHLLASFYSDTENLIDATLSTYSYTLVAQDDVIDALALAETAVAKGGRLASIPLQNERDGEDLPMEMVHAPLDNV